MLVEKARRPLFERIFAEAKDRWSRRSSSRATPGRAPELSVLMSRADARTVSRTTVDVCRQTVALRHHWFDDALGVRDAGPARRLSLSRIEIAA